MTLPIMKFRKYKQASLYFLKMEANFEKPSLKDSEAAEKAIFTSSHSSSAESWGSVLKSVSDDLFSPNSTIVIWIDKSTKLLQVSFISFTKYFY